MPGKKKQRGRKADMLARKEKHRSEDQGDRGKLFSWGVARDAYWANRAYSGRKSDRRSRLRTERAVGASPIIDL